MTKFWGSGAGESRVSFGGNNRMNDLLRVSIPNWEKFNPRADRGNFHWFRMQNDFFLDQRVFQLDAETKLIFMFLLCEGSRKNGEEFELSPEYAGGLLRLPASSVLNAVERLSSFGLVACKTQIDANGTKRNERNGRDETTPDVRVEPLPPGEDRSGALVWYAYADEYQKKYGSAPVRNAKSNSLCKQVIQRLGAKAGPEVARFYIIHRDALYSKNGHPLTLLVRDAEKLHTEWSTGRLITSGDARAGELRQGNVQAAREAIERMGGGNV